MCVCVCVCVCLCVDDYFAFAEQNDGGGARAERGTVAADAQADVVAGRPTAESRRVGRDDDDDDCSDNNTNRNHHHHHHNHNDDHNDDVDERRGAWRVGRATGKRVDATADRRAR